MPTVYSPPVSTFIALATTTLGASASSVTFSSIPADYRDLVLVLNVPLSDNFVYIKPNGVSTDLSEVLAYAFSGGYASNSRTGFWRDVPSGSMQRAHIYHFLDYSATDKHKAMLSRQNNGTDVVTMQAGRWGSTTAISSLVIERVTGSLPVGTIASLYGIEA